jgi:hypothetical protein
MKYKCICIMHLNVMRSTWRVLVSRHAYSLLLNSHSSLQILNQSNTSLIEEELEFQCVDQLSHHLYTMSASARPDFQLPPASPHTVNVSIINTGADIQNIPSGKFFSPARSEISSIPGHSTMVGCPVFSFLISHPTQRRTVLFDLGIRPD